MAITFFYTEGREANQCSEPIGSINTMFVWYKPKNDSSELKEGLTYVVKGDSEGYEDVGNAVAVGDLAQKVLDVRKKNYEIIIGKDLGGVDFPLPHEVESDLLKLIGSKKK